MNSCIFSFERNTAILSPARRFLVAFTSVLLIGMACVTGLTVGGGGGLPIIGASFRPSNNHWFLSYYGKPSKYVHSDHDVFYYGVGDSVENARKADVLILGSSLALFGFEYRLLDEFAERHDIKIFNMAFPGEPSGDFAQEIIRKFRLRPKIIIVLAEVANATAFFTHSLSGHSQTAITQGWLKSAKEVFSMNVRWRLENILRFLLPERIFGSSVFSNNQTMYRSCINGCYLQDERALGWMRPPPSAFERQQAYFRERIAPVCPLTDETAKAALAFKEAMNEIGAQVVLCYIPFTPNLPPLKTRELETRTMTPFIEVDDAGLSWYEAAGGHLDSEGSILFTIRFLEKFEESEPFRNMVANRQRGEINFQIGKR